MNKIYDTIDRHCKCIKNASTYAECRMARGKALGDLNVLAKCFDISLVMKVFFLKKIFGACVESGAMPSESCLAFGNKKSRRYN